MSRPPRQFFSTLRAGVESCLDLMPYNSDSVICTRGEGMSLLAVAISFCAERSGHKGLDRLIDIEMTRQDGSNRFADWKR